MIKVYGIPNCDTIKKTLNWMKENEVDYEFHDYKKEGVTAARLHNWCRQLGWENLVNKSGTTWKALSENEKSAVIDENSAVKLLMENTSIIRRPVVEVGRKYLVRFDEQKYTEVLLKK